MGSYSVVSSDLSNLHERFSDDNLTNAQTLFAMKVGEDCQMHIPRDNGYMEDTMQNASNFEKGEVTWDTDYAGYVYAMDDSHIHRSGNKNTNPNARSHWFEVTKSERLDEWKDFMEKRLS